MTESSRSRRPDNPSAAGNSGSPKNQDHTLLQRIAEGDERALAALYDRWGQRVHDIAYWILGDEDEAEDVVEDTFWQVWRTAARYDWRRATGVTWLAIIARSRALDRLRSRRRMDASDLIPLIRFSLAERGTGDGGGPELQQERADLHDALVSALAALPVDQRQVLELTFFKGLSHLEVAKRIEQPLGTVKTRIRLAIRKLRLSLGYLRDEAP